MEYLVIRMISVWVRHGAKVVMSLVKKKIVLGVVCIGLFYLLVPLIEDAAHFLSRTDKPPIVPCGKPWYAYYHISEEKATPVFGITDLSAEKRYVQHYTLTLDGFTVPYNPQQYDFHLLFNSPACVIDSTSHKVLWEVYVPRISRSGVNSSRASFRGWIHKNLLHETKSLDDWP